MVAKTFKQSIAQLEAEDARAREAYDRESKLDAERLDRLSFQELVSECRARRARTA